MMHIAIFGCGQLAQMTAQAGITLGLRFSFIAEPTEDARCVVDLGKVITYHQAMTAEELFIALDKPDVITVEKEMVDAQLLNALQVLTKVYPQDQAVYLSQNRIREKNFLRHNGIPTAEFEVIESQQQLDSLPERLGFPIYIKAAEAGYDGYHQWCIKTQQDLKQVTLTDDVTLIAEKHVDYSREISIIAARNPQGEIVFYPLMENRHEDGVLIATIAPAPNTDIILEEGALAYMEAILSSLDYVGVLTMECFVTPQGLVANELAPRVHNSGHWSIEGSVTSQFENHCRAITGMVLGDTTATTVVAMVNVLGKHALKEDYMNENIAYHEYGKQERPRRKLGHITFLAADEVTARMKVDTVLTQLYGEQYSPR